MDFFKTVFSEIPQSQPSDSPDSQSENPILDEHIESNPNSTRVWSFGGLIQTLASKSESVVGTYRRDLEEFGSGLRKETAVIREAASRVVKDLPTSLDVGASVAQESLETVGQAIDDIGSSVWRSTAKIIIHGRNSLLVSDVDSNMSDSKQFIGSGSGNDGMELKRYSRYDAQLRAIQGDLDTYCLEPEDLEEYVKWKLGFLLDEKGEEIENLIGENVVIREIYGKVVPSRIDYRSFWSRYFYRVHKLRQAEDARVRLVKRAISGEEEEDLSWDFDEEDDEESNGAELKAKNDVGDSEDGDLGVSESNSDNLVVKFDEKLVSERKMENGESCEDSDVSVVLSQPSLPEEDIGWDEIEDIGSSDDNNKIDTVHNANIADLRKQLRAAEEEEDLSWDIEDDDDGPVNHD